MEIGEAVVQTVIVHQVGNRLREEPLVLVDQCFSSTDSISNLILGGYLRGIVNDKNSHQLTHEVDISLNDVAHHIETFFAKGISFVELSKRIATHLYTSTHHPNIAAGDLFVILFDKLKKEDRYYSAIGIYKSESKQQYISAKTDGEAHELEVLTGVNPDLIDKGALIIQDTNIVYALDRFSKRTKYWMEDFLKARQIPDEKTKSSIAISLVEKVRENIHNPVARQEFGKKIIEFCSKRDEVSGSELKKISEEYVDDNLWDTELQNIAERKSLIDIRDIKFSTKKLETKFRKTFSRIDLGRDIQITIPSNLLFGEAQFEIVGDTIQINVVLENKNG